MYVNLQKEHIAPVMVAQPYKDAWLQANRGVLSQVARQLKPKVSKQFVHAVFRGKRTSRRVERALAKLRAPGFENGKAA